MQGGYCQRLIIYEETEAIMMPNEHNKVTVNEKPDTELVRLRERIAALETSAQHYQHIISTMEARQHLIQHLADNVEQVHLQRKLAETLIETANVLNRTLDLEQVLQAILHQLARVTDYDSASVMLIERGTHRIVAHRGFYPTDKTPLKISASTLAHVQEVLVHQRPVIISDTMTDPRWFSHPASDYIRCWMGVPLLVRDEVVGLLNLNKRQPNFYTDTHAALASTFAGQAAIAVNNAQLYQQTRLDATTKAELLNEVNHRVKNSLMSISGLLLLEKRHAQKQGLDEVVAVVDRLNQRTESLIRAHALLSKAQWQPISLSSLVFEVLQAVLTVMPDGHRFQLTIAPSEVTISPHQAHNLALVINELVTNTIKHALAFTDTPQIRVDLVYLAGDEIQLTYHDNGPGYPPALLAGDGITHTVGLSLVQRIVTRTLEGTVTFDNQQGAVTTLTFCPEDN